MALDRRVVVIAGSIEGIDALARLIHGLPADFPVPVVAYVHGLHEASKARLMHHKLGAQSSMRVVFARDKEKIEKGFFYIAPVSHELSFTGLNTLECTTPAKPASADRLFESAAAWHGAGTLGIILSGLGHDGVKGFEAITDVGGTRVVQSPSEASFTAMPSNALMGDHVEHSVVLDQMVEVLKKLLARMEKALFFQK